VACKKGETYLHTIQVLHGGEDSHCDLLGFDVIDDGKSESKGSLCVTITLHNKTRPHGSHTNTLLRKTKSVSRVIWQVCYHASLTSILKMESSLRQHIGRVNLKAAIIPFATEGNLPTTYDDL
jgi:hypothetical protein